jgi:glycerol-3-phosphate O-acyltransferase
MATNAGVTQAFFPEGGLSLDGKLAPAKLGLLSYVINDFDPETDNDVVFIPVGLNYDRVLEDRVLLEAATKEERRFRFRLVEAIGFLFRQLRNALRGRFHRFGGASMCYGRPVSLAGVSDRRAENVGATLMKEMSDAVPVLPVPLVASILAAQTKPVSRDDIHKLAVTCVDQLRARGACIHLPSDDVAVAVQLGIRILFRRGILVQENKMFVVGESERDVLQFYAASISQFLDEKFRT